MRRFPPLRALMLCIGPCLGGCGLFTPELHDFYARLPQEGEENVIVNQVKCEIHKGIQDAIYDPRFYPATAGTGKSVDWIKGWAAKVTFDLTVEEASNLNPSIGFTDPSANALLKFVTGVVTVGRSFSLGAGLKSNADATHKEIIGFTYAIQQLLDEGPINQPCANEDGVQIHSDLKIAEFIKNKLFIARVPGSIANESTKNNSKNLPYSDFSYDISFVLSYGGNITPMWKFTRIAVDPSAGVNLFDISRKKTQHVAITLAPIEQPARPATATTAAKPAEISQSGQLSHNALLIGNAVATALQSLSLP